MSTDLAEADPPIAPPGVDLSFSVENDPVMPEEQPGSIAERATDPDPSSPESESTALVDPLDENGNPTPEPPSNAVERNEPEEAEIQVSIAAEPTTLTEQPDDSEEMISDLRTEAQRPRSWWEWLRGWFSGS